MSGKVASWRRSCSVPVDLLSSQRMPDPSPSGESHSKAEQQDRDMGACTGSWENQFKPIQTHFNPIKPVLSHLNSFKAFQIQLNI